MIKSATIAICTALRRFARNTGGATAIEYALIAGGISIVIVGTVTALGANVTGMFTTVSSALK